MTGISPAELLLGRCPRSRLDLLKPHTAESVERNQLRQKEQHDSKSRERKLNVEILCLLRTTILVTNGYLV